MMSPSCARSSPLGDGTLCDNPGQVAGNTSSLQEGGCPGGGSYAPENVRVLKKSSVEIIWIDLTLLGPCPATEAPQMR
jgi:hypothetical protein